MNNNLTRVKLGDNQGTMPVLSGSVYKPSALLTHIADMTDRIMSEDESEEANPSSAAPTTSLGMVADTIRFITEPIPLATLTLIRSSARFRAVSDPYTASLIYLVLARYESGYDVGAEARTTSAAGAIQLTQDAYNEGLRMGNALLAACPPSAVAFMEQIFNVLPSGSGQGWKSGAHSDPEDDRTQFIASAGRIYSNIDTVNHNWRYQNGVWRTSALQTPRISYLQTRFHDTLANRLAGLQLLVTIYHIEGLNWLHNKGDWAPHHPDRFISDPNLIKQLASDPSIQTTLEGVDRFKDKATQTGDPVSSAKEIGFPFLIPLFSFLKKTIPTIKGRWGEKRKINKSRGIHHAVHKGLDLRASEGTPILAVADGKITEVYHSTKPGSWGNSIVLTTDNGDGYRYAHLSAVDVKEGAKVTLGQTLGKTGHTGVKEPHLHFEFYPKGGKSSDPLKDPNSRWVLSLKLK